MKYKTGDRVIIDNKYEGTILREYVADMYVVRIWDGLRHVGDKVCDLNYIKLCKGL